MYQKHNYREEEYMNKSSLCYQGRSVFYSISLMLKIMEGGRHYNLSVFVIQFKSELEMQAKDKVILIWPLHIETYSAVGE